MNSYFGRGIWICSGIPSRSQPVWEVRTSVARPATWRGAAIPVCHRRARTGADLSQQRVASEIDCTQGFISRAEAGQMMLRAIDYPPVADLLGVDVLELIGPLTEEERSEIEASNAEAAEANRRDGFEGGV